MGKALGISNGGVGSLMVRWKALGLSWQEAEKLSDDELEQRLYGPRLPSRAPRPMPDMHWLYRELRRPAVTMELLHLGNSGVGYLNSAFGIGGLVGAAVTVALVARQKLASDFAIGTLLWGIPLILIGIFPSSASALVLIAFIGIGDTLVEVAAPTLLQRAVPDEVLGRVFGAVESLIIGAE